MRYHKKTQYNDSSKDEALATISNEKQKIIDQLIINFDLISYSLLFHSAIYCTLLVLTNIDKLLF